MNKQLIAQLRAKHEASLACLTLIENGTEADMKNIAGKWYESLLIDIIEMQVPENEKPEYHNLDWEAHNEAIDEIFTGYDIAEKSRVHVTMHEEFRVPTVAHNLSY